MNALVNTKINNKYEKRKQILFFFINKPIPVTLSQMSIQAATDKGSKSLVDGRKLFPAKNHTISCEKTDNKITAKQENRTTTLKINLKLFFALG